MYPCVNFLGDASTRYNVELLQIYLYKAFSKGILVLISWETRRLDTMLNSYRYIYIRLSLKVSLC